MTKLCKWYIIKLLADASYYTTRRIYAMDEKKFCGEVSILRDKVYIRPPKSGEVLKVEKLDDGSVMVSVVSQGIPIYTKP